MTQRLIVGVTGASGAAYAVALMRLLARTNVETHLVVTEAGAEVLSTETSSSPPR